MINELLASQLFNRCSVNELDFVSTADLSPLDSLIDQEEACRSLDFALKIKGAFSNVFLACDVGVDAVNLATSKSINLAMSKNICLDWCYAHNFDDPLRPLAISLPKFFGSVFKSSMLGFASDFSDSLIQNLSSENTFSKQKNVLSRFFNKQLSVVQKISRIAESYGFLAQNDGANISFFPSVDGSPLLDQELINLPPDTRKTFEQNLLVVHKLTGKLVAKLQSLYTQLDLELLAIDKSVAVYTIDDSMKSLFDILSASPKALSYLDSLKNFLSENFALFLSDDEIVLNKLFAMFDVNVISSFDGTGASVVVGKNLSENSLFGSVSINHDGELYDSNVMSINSGLLHKANGGFVVLNAKDIFESAGVFYNLLKMLKNKSLDFNLLYDDLPNFSKIISPEPVPLDVKVIVVGDSWYYDAFKYYDPDFYKLFPIKIELDNEISYNVKNICDFARAIKSFVVEENILDFDALAVCRVVDYANKLAQNRNKLSNNFDDINEILKEASTWAEIDEASLVLYNHVEKAVVEKYKRSKLWQNKLEKLYVDNVFMIDTFGAVVGQINALCVTERNGSNFGSLTRITATTCVGKAGIVNIEKESDLSGKSHNKGIQIINGWLGQTYAQKFPLSLSCRICFEQNYNGIDGDSASSTELYCIISSLAKLPIRQDLAVTGSVNQRGIIQAVGGVNYKIEGFFNLCKKRGLKGTEGVIIPEANKIDLVLDDEIVRAVDEGLFHIYAISNIEEGMELLMCESADLIHKNVLSTLKDFNEFAKGY